MSVSNFPIPDFEFDSGDSLNVNLVYKSINPSATKTALIINYYTGRLEELITYTAPDSALADYHVVVVAQMGNGESSSPSNTPNFPNSVTYQDQVRAQYKLVTEKLGFKQLDVVLGLSMGGQAAYHWAAIHPNFVKNGVELCATARSSGQTYVIVESMLVSMTLSADWEAYQKDGTKPVKGLKALMRVWIAWLNNPAWFDAQVYKHAGLVVKNLDEFLRFAEDALMTHDPNDLIVAARQVGSADVGRIGGGLEKTLGSIKARMLVMPSKRDYLFPPDQCEADVKLLKHGELDVIDSIWGHTAPMYSPPDIAYIDKKVKAFLSK